MLKILCIYSLFLFIYWPHRTACRILVPWPGIEPVPLHCKYGVLTTALSGNSLYSLFLKRHKALHTFLLNFSHTSKKVYKSYVYHLMKWTYCVAAAAAKLLQSCPILCDPIDGSPPGFSVHGILQARTLEWVPFPSSMHESGKWKWSRSVVSNS